MVTETILKPIGKGQITIPKEWREQLGIDQKSVRATIQGNRIIIEAIPQKKVTWDIKQINLSELNKENQNIVKKGLKDYQEGKFDKFSSHDEFWNDI